MDMVPSIFARANTEAETKAWAEGVRAADEGRVVSHKAVTRWLLSWGTDHELPRPDGGSFCCEWAGNVIRQA
jgi:predicted transcriptional regulator